MRRPAAHPTSAASSHIRETLARSRRQLKQELLRDPEIDRIVVDLQRNGVVLYKAESVDLPM